MYQPIPASSNALTLDDVIARLTKRDIIAGILTIGSTAKHTIIPASDYDLLLILANKPKGLQPYSITHIDGRFTDLLFATSADLDDILARWQNRKAEKRRSRTDQSFLVPKPEIAENDYDLSVNRYKELEYETVQHDTPNVILRRLAKLEKQIAKGREELEEMLG